MNVKDVDVQESPGVQLAKKMLERQRQTIKEAIEVYNNPDSSIRKMVEELKQKNAKRGTPIIRL